MNHISFPQIPIHIWSSKVTPTIICSSRCARLQLLLSPTTLLIGMGRGGFHPVHMENTRLEKIFSGSVFIQPNYLFSSKKKHHPYKLYWPFFAYMLMRMSASGFSLVLIPGKFIMHLSKSEKQRLFRFGICIKTLTLTFVLSVTIHIVSQNDIFLCTSIYTCIKDNFKKEIYKPIKSAADFNLSKCFWFFIIKTTAAQIKMKIFTIIS